MSTPRNITPSNFVVLVEVNVTYKDDEELFPALKILSEEHKDSAAARSWLKKNLTEVVKLYGEKATFRLANLQPPLQQKIEMVAKLTLE